MASRRKEPPHLSDFFRRRYGNDWHVKNGWRPQKAGAVVITREQYDDVLMEWRRAWQEWEREVGR